MFEDQDTAYHSQEESYDSAESTESYESAESHEPTETIPTEPQGLKVKYNKEEMFIPDNDVPAYVQKGLNYDKVQQQLEQTRQEAAYLDRLARMSGYQDKNAFLQAIEQAEQQQQYETYAQKMGIDVEAYQQHIAPVFNEVQTLRSELQNIQQQKLLGDLQGQLSHLRSAYPDFDQYQQQVYELATTKGYDLEDAYILASYKNRLSDVERSTEQKVVNQIRNRQGKHVEGSDNNAPMDLGLSQAEMETAKRMGLSPEEYAKWK